VVARYRIPPQTLLPLRFADVCVLSDTLYAYKTDTESNWIVGKCEDNTVLDIQTGEELIPYLQDDAFAFNAYAEPNNFLYDAEGNLIWEATGKIYDGGPYVNYMQYSINGYCDDILFLYERDGFKTIYLDGLDEKWQYADVTTFTEISEKYDAAALFHNDMGIIISSGHPAIIDRDFNVLFTDETISAEDITSMGHGYYKIKLADGYKLLTVSVEIVE